MIMSLKQRKTKFKPRINVNHNIYNVMSEAFFYYARGYYSSGEGIFRFSAPFHSFRTSRSILWPLNWNSRYIGNDDLLFRLGYMLFNKQ